MNITGVQVFGYELTYRHGTYVMSGGRAAAAQQSTLVAITTDSGITGWGEVCTLGSTYLPAFAAGVRAGIAELAPALIGHDALNIRGALRLMDEVLLEQRAAKSPIDIALWDVLGQATGQPIAQLTGGIQTPEFPLYEAVPLEAPERMVGFVEARMAEGIRRFQLKVGNEPELDAARTRAVVEAVPDDVIVIADANGGWDVHDAIKAARLIGDIPVYIEEPCRGLDNNVLVARQIPQQLVLDECIVTLDDLYRAKYDAGISAINLKYSRIGGFSRTLQLRDAAQSLGLKVSMEDTWGGDITSAAVSHLAATTAPETLFNVSFMNDWTNEHVAGYEPRSSAGRGRALTGPGLGTTVDESALTPVAEFR
ncbi:mandelate racemase/muconate lactonizing enzyme family protein [Leucobacter sp. G161]|uniref:mandelate racemase/muconate lactonizing enzyme family protein n=1 Tax=Leucobacter sp. G161 TaxID=663704 RepID=UPI00073AEC14|nr:mandelate racemase/muconate lactonizing enzyme family protein [Leucobacter sp. G161]KUF07860.1 mandelate racemase [Leucobacter sp. G161]